MEDKVDAMQTALDQDTLRGVADAKVDYTASQEPESAERLTSDRGDIHRTATSLLAAPLILKGQESSTVHWAPRSSSNTANKGMNRATETIRMGHIAVSPEPRHRQRSR